MKTARSLISLKYINAKFILTISSTEGYLWEFIIIDSVITVESDVYFRK